MADSQKASVFFVGMKMHERNGFGARLMRSKISCERFHTVEPCLEALAARPCHLLVITLNGNASDGLQLLGYSEPMTARIPKLALVAHGDISTAVQAIRAGATNCLEKPVDSERLFAEITALLREVGQNNPPLESTLTPTETTILHLLLENKTNHEAARALHRSPRTIEVHRGHIMHKLGASNMVDLVRTAALMGFLRA